MVLWKQHVLEEVRSIADEAQQRTTWFGKGPLVDSSTACSASPPAGLSATRDSNTRSDYDMISARRELDLQQRLERLDAPLLRSAGVDPEAVSFEFRPLWQMSGAERAQVALSKAPATAIYAELKP